MPRIQPRALLAALLAAVLVASIGPAAGAQSEADVAAARAEADLARRTRLAAESALSSVSADFLAAIDRYQSLTAALSATTHGLIDLRDEVRATEAAVRQRRADTRALIIGAYAGATRGELSVAFDARSVEDLMLLQDLMARSAVVRDSSIDELEANRVDLAAQRSTLEQAEATARQLRIEAENLVDRLTDLVSQAVTDRATAVVGEQSAAEGYATAVDRLEAAKRSISPGAYRWRSLVERYFPASLTWQALQVLDCESGGDPLATNAESGASGLFQFLDGTWIFASALAGFRGADPYDPEANVAAAAWLVDHSEIVGHPRGTWGHWECQPVVGDR